MREVRVIITNLGYIKKSTEDEAIKRMAQAVQDAIKRLTDGISKEIHRLESGFVLADAIAERTPFSAAEIYSLRQITGSWDAVLAACGYAAKHGCASPAEAYKLMRKEHSDTGLVTDTDLYVEYGEL